MEAACMYRMGVAPTTTFRVRHAASSWRARRLLRVSPQDVTDSQSKPICRIPTTPQDVTESRRRAALVGAAEAAFEGGQIDSCFRTLLAMHDVPPSARVCHLLARCYAIRGDPQTALAHFAKAAACDPCHWQSRVCVAECVIVHRVASDSAANVLAHRCAREALAIIEAEPPVLASAETRSAHIRCHWLLSRLAGVVEEGGGAQASAAHMANACRLASRWLDAPTSRLPRLGTRAASETPLPGLRRPVHVSRLARFPLLLRARGLLEDSECEYVISRARPHLESSEVHLQRSVATSYRTSRTAWIPTADDATLGAIAVRVATLMGVPPAALLHGESPDSGNIQVVAYRPGEYYGTHHDCNGLLRRYATVLVYLNDCDGGQTCFPAASDDPKAWAELRTADEAIACFMDPARTASPCSTSESAGKPMPHGDAQPGYGVQVQPRRGDAVIFYNFDGHGRLDPRAVHSALPLAQEGSAPTSRLRSGSASTEKWVANFWLTITPNELLSQIQ